MGLGRVCFFIADVIRAAREKFATRLKPRQSRIEKKAKVVMAHVRENERHSSFLPCAIQLSLSCTGYRDNLNPDSTRQSNGRRNTYSHPSKKLF